MSEADKGVTTGIGPDVSVSSTGSRWSSSGPHQHAEGSLIGGVSEVQGQELANHAIETVRAQVTAGTLTLEKANEMLQNGGLPPLGEKKEAEPPSNEQIFDQTFAPPQSPAHYSNLPPLAPHGTEANLADEVQFRTAAFAAGMSQDVARSMADVIRQANLELNGITTEDDFRSWTNSQRRALESIWGAKTLENVKVVAKYLADLDQKAPGTARTLLNSPATNSALFAKMIFDHVTRLNMRQGGMR